MEMANQLSRRHLLTDFGGVAAGALTARNTAPGPISAGPCGVPAPFRPVAPVNREVAARHGTDFTAMPQSAVGIDVESLLTVNNAADIAAG
jgi:hypothetical protein